MFNAHRFSILAAFALAAGCTYTVDEPSSFDTGAGGDVPSDGDDSAGDDSAGDDSAGDDSAGDPTTDGTASGGDDSDTGDDSTGGDPTGGDPTDGEPGGTTGDAPEEVCGNLMVEAGEDCDGSAEYEGVECSGECAFECVAEQGDCNEDLVVDGCETWLMMGDNCGACGTVCAPGNSCVQGACGVTSTHGNDTEMSDDNVALAHNLLGSMITVSGAATLTHISTFSKQTGPNGQFALYADLNGEPGALVAQTPEVVMTSGMMEVPITEPVEITPGNYWILGVFDINASVGVDTSDTSAVVMYIPFTFGTAFPEQFPVAANYTGQILNYFVTVQ